MKLRWTWWAAVGVTVAAMGWLVVVWQTTEAGAQPASSRPADEKAIREATQAFARTFEKGDGKALAALWTEEGEYIGEDGVVIRGRPALEKAYADFFAKNKIVKIEVDMDSLRFVSRDTAIEEGHMKVHKEKSETPTVGRYSVLHVRETGKWLMAVVREWSSDAVTLRDVEWMIGAWSAQREGVDVHTSYEWDPKKVYILGRFTIKEKERTHSGTMRIARDPSTGLLRSWTFEDEGGFGDAVWSREGKKWLQEANGVRPDGAPMTATNIITRLNDDAFTWQSINRTTGGVEQPDLPPIKVTRVKSKP